MLSKKNLLLSNLILLFVVCSTFAHGKDRQNQINKKQSKLSEIFNLDKVATITLTFSEDEWNKLLFNFDENKKNEKYVKASFHYTNGAIEKEFRSSGVRIRGNMSRERPEGKKGEKHNRNNPDWHHAHFKVNFGKFETEKSSNNFKGLKGINLKWLRDDSMYVREVYSYDLFKRFDVWTAINTVYTKLYIKVGDTPKAYFGIYEMIEPIDKQFIKKRFSKKQSQGYLWKCSWGANMLGMKSVGIEDPDNNRQFSYDLKTNKKDFDEATKLLSDFITNLNTLEGIKFKLWLKKHLDIDLLLRAYAVNVLVGMWDDYWANNGNNYYIYFDPDGKGYFIPYDYDNTLGTSVMMENSATQDVMNWGNKNAVLITKILQIPEYRKLYIDYIKELINEKNDLFDAQKSIDRIKKWQEVIRPYIKNDTGEDIELIDKPAEWGNCHFYRLLSGDDSGALPEANYFKTRIKFAKEQLKKPAQTGKPKEKLYPDWQTFTPRVPYSFYTTNVLTGITEDGKIYYILQEKGKPVPTLEEMKQQNKKSEYIQNGVIKTKAKDYKSLSLYNLEISKEYELYMIGEGSNGKMQPKTVFKMIKITPQKPDYDSIEYEKNKVIFRVARRNRETPLLAGNFNNWLENEKDIKKWTMEINEKTHFFEIEVDKSLIKAGDQYIFFFGKNLKEGMGILDPANPDFEKNARWDYVSIIK